MPAIECLLTEGHRHGRRNRLREEGILQLGVDGYGFDDHLMAWLEALHDGLEGVREHQAIHLFVIAKVNLNRTGTAIHAAGNAVDLNLQERLRVDPYTPYLT